MQIDIKYIILISILIIFILWYAKGAYCEVDRYKKIIDKYIEEPDNKKKSILKKVSIIEPNK
jgi:hypothetical protein